MSSWIAWHFRTEHTRTHLRIRATLWTKSSGRACIPVSTTIIPWRLGENWEQRSRERYVGITLACSSLCWNLRRERTNDEGERSASKINGVIGHPGENVLGRVTTTLQRPTIRQAML